MPKIHISSPARPNWSDWYISSPFFITSAGVYQEVSLSFSADGAFQDTLSVELRYYRNGWKTETQYIGFGNEILLEVGGDAQDEMHTVRFRVQNNSSTHIFQGITLESSHSFVREPELQQQFAIPRAATESASGYNHSSSLNFGGIIGSQMGRASSGIVDRIIGNNPNIFQATVGRTLSRSVERFADALAKGRIQSMEDAFTSVLGGKNGTGGFAAGIGNQVIGGLLQAGFSKLFGGSTKTRSYETTRSIEATDSYRLSQGQQAAEALATLKKGERNL